MTAARAKAKVERNTMVKVKARAKATKTIKVDQSKAMGMCKGREHGCSWRYQVQTR
jgi:hypothetical protein